MAWSWHGLSDLDRLQLIEVPITLLNFVGFGLNAMLKIKIKKNISQEIFCFFFLSNSILILNFT